MTTRTVQVSLQEDLDKRPIAMLVQMASQFDSSVYIDCDSKHVNAKSIMGMMTLALKSGDSVDVVAEGTDEADAAEHIGRFLKGELLAVC